MTILTASTGILVYSDIFDLTLEIVGKGRNLADRLKSELSVALVGRNLQEKARELIAAGADKVFLADDAALESFQAETCLGLVHDLATKNNPEIILIGSTKNGKPLAARLATRLETGCIPDCINLSIDTIGSLVGERIAYGGNAVAKVTFKSRPQVATIPSRAFEKVSPQERNGEIIKIDANLEKQKIEVIERKPIETSMTRIEDAPVIVSCGRGLEKKEDRVLLDGIAGALCGQVGCTRPLVEDRKWFSEWVGLSGHKVRPRLYIACGISGVIQHVAGIRDAKVIVAINKDPEAPIFEMADYGIVGNLYEVLPALKEALKRQLG